MTTIARGIDPFDPAIDQPTTIDFDDLNAADRFSLSNTELHFQSDRESNLYDLFWTWHDRPYARSISVRITAPIYTSQGITTDPVDDVTPMVVRFFPGYQETIYGTEEGVIVSKRIFAPLGSGYDRSLLWLMECQAEGDRLVRIEVDIDWGMPLEQRIVDGLLVAQANPGEAEGIHGQQNAESTCIFGTGGGRPDWVHFPDQQSAQLVYHLLVAGEVDLPLILAVSDVGEQVAWNGFLALRDITRSFKLSQDVWTKVSRSGRLWTPFSPLNRAVQLGKEAAVHDLRRLRTGHTASDQRVASVPPLVDLFDTFEPAQSRNLLDHLHRLADRSGGRLPVEMPTLPGPTPAPDPGIELIETNLAYLKALANHLSRQPNRDLLDQHYAAAARCAEMLIGALDEFSTLDGAQIAHIQTGLYLASRLAGLHEESADEARWVSETARLATATSQGADVRMAMGEWTELDALADLGALSPVQLMSIAGEALWRGCGISVRNGEIYLSPQWPQVWGWWALLDLPVMGGALSLLWDGETLHSTRPVRFDGAVAQHDRIRAEGSDVDNFALRFHLRSGSQEQIFRPSFYSPESWRNRDIVRGFGMDK